EERVTELPRRDRRRLPRSLFHLGEHPAGVVVGEGGEGREGLDLPQGGEPAPRPGPEIPLPAFEELQGVEDPQQEELERGVEEGGVTDVREHHPAMEEVERGGGRDPLRGELLRETPQPGAREGTLLQNIQSPGVELELVLPRR